MRRCCGQGRRHRAWYTWGFHSPIKYLLPLAIAHTKNRRDDGVRCASPVRLRKFFFLLFADIFPERTIPGLPCLQRSFSLEKDVTVVRSANHKWTVPHTATVASASAPRGGSEIWSSGGSWAVISRCALMPATIYGARNSPWYSYSKVFEIRKVNKCWLLTEGWSASCVSHM